MNEIEQKKEYQAKAFVSCSLRPEDEPFVDFICSILKAYNIKPFGTVGKFSASPENPVTLMNKNIKNADIVVICATPRYIQKDIQNGNESNGLSEMIHVETGMAIAHEKPVVVFAKEGTNVGSALPNITQYVVLTGSKKDYNEQKDKIHSLLNNAYKYSIEEQKKIQEEKQDKESTENWAAVGKFATLALAFTGIIKFIQKDN